MPQLILPELEKLPEKVQIEYSEKGYISGLTHSYFSEEEKKLIKNWIYHPNMDCFKPPHSGQ